MWILRVKFHESWFFCAAFEKKLWIFISWRIGTAPLTCASTRQSATSTSSPSPGTARRTPPWAFRHPNDVHCGDHQGAAQKISVNWPREAFRTQDWTPARLISLKALSFDQSRSREIFWTVEATFPEPRVDSDMSNFVTLAYDLYAS